MPKRGLDVKCCEMYRFYKMHNNGFVEPLPMTVPRRVRHSVLALDHKPLGAYYLLDDVIKLIIHPDFGGWG